MFWTLPIAFVLASTQPRDTAQLAALIQRVEQGDADARKQLEAMGRPLAIDAAQRKPDLVTARTLARIAFTLAQPTSDLDSALTHREQEWREPAVRALRYDLAADSGDSWAADALERIAPYPYIWLPAANELTQLRALAARRSDLPGDVAVARIHLEVEVGSVDSAAAALSRLTPDQASPAVRGRVAAEVAFARGDSAAGVAAYYTGAAAIADRTDIAPYTEDLAWIATPAELAEWAAVPQKPGGHRERLQRFWMRRDLEDGRPAGSRLAEHFRRWRLALRNYRWDVAASIVTGVFSDRGFVNEDPEDAKRLTAQELPVGSYVAVNYVNRWSPHSRVLDDRGWLVMRHGDPVTLPMAGSIETTMEQNLAWQTPAGRLIVGFSRVLIGSERYGMIGRNIPMGDRMVACQYDARMCSGYELRLLVEDYGHQRETLEHTDGNAETYHDSLGAIVQTYGIPQGGTLIVVAVPARGLVRDSAKRAALHQFAARLQVVIGDSAAGTIVATVDTTRRWTTTNALSRDAWLSTYLTVPVNPGNWDVVVTVSDTAHTTGTGRRFGAVPVPAFDGTVLALGDPILGRHDAGLTWTHNGTAIALNPTNAWRRDQAVTVHYDIDGQVPGRRYDTQFELWSAKGHPKAPAFTIAFSATASTARSTVERELSPAHLEPGEYRLVLRVHDSVTGKDVTRERYVAVLK